MWIKNDYFVLDQQELNNKLIITWNKFESKQIIEFNMNCCSMLSINHDLVDKSVVPYRK